MNTTTITHYRLPLKTTIYIICLFVIMTGQSTVFTQPIQLHIWSGNPPGSLSSPLYRQDTVFTETGFPRIRHVTDPEMYVYLPSNSKQNNPAVIICPGGSYGRLAIDHEGHDVAQWLTRAGMAGIVLKYRLPSDTIMVNRSVGPLQDVQEAIRIVRRRSAEWRIDTGKVGVMGFSAGGHLAGSASTLYGYPAYHPSDSTSARPDFSILIYGALSMEPGLDHGGSRKNLLGSTPDTLLVNLFSAERNVTRNTPPAFIVHSANDPAVPVASSLAYFTALKDAQIPAELHIYETGKHGYGLGIKGGTESEWPDACLRWLKARGILNQQVPMIGH